MAPLLPLAVAVGGAVQLASVIWAAAFAIVGAACTTLAYRALRSWREKTALCSWKEVERDLDRELRRIQWRRFRSSPCPRRLLTAMRHVSPFDVQF